MPGRRFKPIDPAAEAKKMLKRYDGRREAASLCAQSYADRSLTTSRTEFWLAVVEAINGP